MIFWEHQCKVLVKLCQLHPFTESLTKAIRSLEIGKTGIRNIDNRFISLDKHQLQEEINVPRPRRIFAILKQ